MEHLFCSDFLLYMLKESEMKCPKCGNELNAKGVCVKCIEKPEKTEEDIEVEYKEFKVSEFLEIRKKQHVPGSEVISKPARIKPQRVTRESIKSSPLSRGRITNQDKNKKLFVFLIAVLLGIAAITGAVYILRIIF